MQCEQVIASHKSWTTALLATMKALQNEYTNIHSETTKNAAAEIERLKEQVLESTKSLILKE